MAHTIVRRHRRKGRSVRMHSRKVDGGSREPLKFFDLKARRSFTTSNYKVVVKSGRRFAVATTPGGRQSFRIVGKGVK